MSNGLGDALGWTWGVKEEGDGENGYSVLPGDPRWLNLYWDDEDTEEIWMVDRDHWIHPDLRKCECGAEKTVNPNCHADWCPKFVNPMGGWK